MSSPTGGGAPRAQPPAPIQAEDQTSLLLTLVTCPTPPTYLTAFEHDIQRRGIQADLNWASKFKTVTKAAKVAKVAKVATVSAAESTDSPVPSSTGISGRALPGMATGRLSSGLAVRRFESSHAPPPVRSQIWEDTGARDVPDYWNAPRENDGRSDRSDTLDNAERAPSMVPMHQETPNKQRSRTYVGYAIVVNLLAPSNLEAYDSLLDDWVGDYAPCVDKNKNALEFRLLLDLASQMDSWVFSHVSWKTATHLQGDTPIPWELFHQERYTNKNRIPLPPRSHVQGKRNIAELAYGSTQCTSRIAIAQTIVKILFKSRTHAMVELPEFPIGAAIGFSPSDIERDEDGVLSLGRQSNAESKFPPKSLHDGPRWSSKTLLGMLTETRRIPKNAFTIFIDHPILVQRPKNVIILGPVYNPGIPDIPADKDLWTTIPVAVDTGLWVVRLDSITVFRTKPEDDVKLEVNADFILDNASSQTYLPNRVMEDLVLQLGSDRLAPKLEREDELVLMFSSALDGSTFNAHGQAKRFFTSAYLGSEGEHRLPFAPTGGTRYILGLNFFTTFMVTFEDGQDPEAHIKVKHHEFVPPSKPPPSKP